MPSTATPREEPSTLTRLLRGAKRGARNVYDGATAQYFHPQEFAQGIADSMVAAPDAIINALRSPRETIRAGLEATKDAFATPERTGATLVGAIPSLINALRGRGPKKDIVISGEAVPRAQKLKLPSSDYWVGEDGVPRAWLDNSQAELLPHRIEFGNNRIVLGVQGDVNRLPKGWDAGAGRSAVRPSRGAIDDGVYNYLMDKAPYEFPARNIHTLPEILRYPDLYKLYPELNDYTVKYRTGTGGNFSPIRNQEGNIQLGTSLLTSADKHRYAFGDQKEMGLKSPDEWTPEEFATWTTTNSPKAIAKHEINHAVQDIANLREGYRGTSPSEYTGRGVDEHSSDLLYFRDFGELEARLAANGTELYGREAMLSPGFAAKQLDTQRRIITEALRGLKERQFLKGK